MVAGIGVLVDLWQLILGLHVDGRNVLDTLCYRIWECGHSRLWRARGLVVYLALLWTYLRDLIQITSL
jgi:hypothetical protein